MAEALVLEEPRTLVHRELALPEIGDDGLLRVEACLLCGTDHELYTDAIAPGFGFVPGHEASRPWRPGAVRAGEFLHGEPTGDGEWSFAIGRERHGAFGGAFGGLVAACCVHAARSLAPGRRPEALDARFLRGLPAGDARVACTSIHEGKSLSCVSVDVIDQRGRLATRATVSLVSSDVLDPLDHDGASGDPPAITPYGDGVAWRNPPGVEVPIITTFSPRATARGGRGIGTSIPVPWNEPGNDAEAACLAADFCVGPPVAGAFPDTWIPHPNPDLSVRFTGAPVADVVTGIGRLEGIDAGLASVRVEVWSVGRLVAIGVSSSLLLRT
ncbi:MAG: thioesterase family protein [Acidimicrobiales bacterium]|nr:thioesterase family protein [Acidimicrobiales bacterium]